MIARVDDAKVGRALRQLRRRRGLRQVDVAALARLAQQTISLIECGHAAAFTIDTVRRAFGALGASYEGMLVWRGGARDRLLDERHAALVGMTAARLPPPGWEVVIEASYSIYGERGSIDILAGHATSRSVLLVEVKSELMSIEELGRKLDEKPGLPGGSCVANGSAGRQPAPGGCSRCPILTRPDEPSHEVPRCWTGCFPRGGRRCAGGSADPTGTSTGSSLSPIPIRLVLAPGGAAGSGSVGRIQRSQRSDESTPRPET